MKCFAGQNENHHCKKIWQQNESKGKILVEMFDVAWVNCTVKKIDRKMAMGRQKRGKIKEYGICIHCKKI